MTESEPWYFDEDPEAVYVRLLEPAKFMPWAEGLIGLAAPRGGERVLDIACGTGVVTRLAAGVVGENGAVVGFDLNERRLELARVAAEADPPAGRATIEWRGGDATALPFDDASFDLVTCQQGLQFFPDRPLAVREMARVLAPGGRLALNVWQSVEQQPGAFAMANSLERHVGADAAAIRRRPFAFGDGSALEALFVDAGFRDVVVRPTVTIVRFSSAEAFTTRYLSGVGPLAALVSQADDAARSAVLADMRIALESHIDSEGLALPTVAHVVTARV